MKDFPWFWLHCQRGETRMEDQASTQLRKRMAITQRPVGAMCLTTTTLALCTHARRCCACSAPCTATTQLAPSAKLVPCV